jgi:hypothetical protein
MILCSKKKQNHNNKIEKGKSILHLIWEEWGWEGKGRL